MLREQSYLMDRFHPFIHFPGAVMSNIQPHGVSVTSVIAPALTDELRQHSLGWAGAQC
jgi:hypothetical protein